MAASGGQFTTTVAPSELDGANGPAQAVPIVVTGLTVLGDPSIVNGLEQVCLFGSWEAWPELTVLLAQLLKSRPWPTRVYVPALCPVTLCGRHLSSPVEIVVSWKEQTF